MVSCDPEGSSSGGAPPRFTLTQNDDGRTFTLTIGEGVKTIAEGEFAAVANIDTGTGKIDLNTKLAGKLGANPKEAVTAIVLPSTLLSIGKYAFIGHIKVQGRFIIPKSVRTIGEKSFQRFGADSNYRLIIEFEKSSQLTAIGDLAFSHVSSRNFIELPELLETIGGGAFMEWKSRATTNSFTIPGNVKSIGNGTFMTVSRPFLNGTLTIVSPHLKKPNLGNNLFRMVGAARNFTTIKLHKAVYDDYTKAELSTIFGTGTITYQDLNGNNHTPKP